MPSEYHTRQLRKCKYCDKEAARQILPTGRNKGHYRTCGNIECLTRQFVDEKVNRRKAFSKPRICEHCGATYIATGRRQRLCLVCAPDKKARWIFWRYGLTHQEYLALIAENDGRCPICLRKAKLHVDHDHATSKVRGAICGTCNTALHLIEDRDRLLRAVEYLGIEL